MHILTADGQSYYASCSDALEVLTNAEHALQSSHRQPSGRLRIDMPAAFGRNVLLPIILDILQQYPELRLTATFSDYLVDPIEEGIDLLVRFGALQDTTGLVARPLTQQQLVVCASPAYITANGAPEHIEELCNHRCIVGHRRGRPLSWTLRDATGKVVRFAPPANLELGDGEAIVTATLAGLGLSQLPISLFRNAIDDGSLVPVLERFSTECVPVNVVWPATRHLLPKVRAVVNELLRRAELSQLD